MRQTYVVSYDISDPKRLRNVFRLMKGYGEHIQLSVFRCDLTHRALVELRARLGAVINHDEDQVLFVDIGPEDGRGSASIAAIGRPYRAPQRCAVIV